MIGVPEVVPASLHSFALQGGFTERIPLLHQASRHSLVHQEYPGDANRLLTGRSRPNGGL